MEEYTKIADYVLKIAEYLENDTISITDIPFDEMIMMIKQLHDVKCQKGDLFAELYRTFLMPGKDKLDIVSALKLFAEYMLIFDEHNVVLKKAYDERRNLLQSMDRQNELLNHQNELLSQRNELIMEKIDKIREVYPRLGYYVNCEKIRDWYRRNEYKARSTFNGKGVIYSAITGDYDDVKEPEYISDEFDYILFTNNPKLKSDVWKVVLVDNEEQLDDVKLSKKIKIMGHEFLPEYDFSVWVDGKFKIKGDIRQYIETYQRNEPMLCFNHYERDCIYAEKEMCISLKKDVPEIMDKQIARYRMEGYPERNGMVEAGFMVRELHDERVKRVMETWWSEVLNGSKRDQLSFNYACWKNDFIYDTSDLCIFENPYVEIYDHNGINKL